MTRKLPRELDARLEKLLDEFQSNGWVFVGSADIQSDWWFDDVLHLTSNWHPVDTNLYLTILLDPQEIQKKSIWCVGFSYVIPNNRHFSYIEKLTLNDLKKNNLVDFVKNVNKTILI